MRCQLIRQVRSSSEIIKDIELGTQTWFVFLVTRTNKIRDKEKPEIFLETLQYLTPQTALTKRLGNATKMILNAAYVAL